MWWAQLATNTVVSLGPPDTPKKSSAGAPVRQSTQVRGSAGGVQRMVASGAASGQQAAAVAAAVVALGKVVLWVW